MQAAALQTLKQLLLLNRAYQKKALEYYQNKQKNADAIIPGAFSISLTVKDINASKQFYENFEFNVFGGDIKKNYLIMKNGNSLIGLFYGMFEKYILTFKSRLGRERQKTGHIR